MCPLKAPCFDPVAVPHGITAHPPHGFTLHAKHEGEPVRAPASSEHASDHVKT